MPAITPISGVIGYVGDSITSADVVTATIGDLNAARTSGPTFVGADAGRAGSTSADWAVLSGAVYMDGLAILAGAGAGIVSIMLGSNDAQSGNLFTKSEYKANMLTIINALLSDGATTIILNQSPWIVLPGPSSLWDSNADVLIPQYGAALAELAAANPTHVFVGDTAAFDYFQTHTDLLQDGVHPTDPDGINTLGQFWAMAYEREFPSAFTDPQEIQMSNMQTVPLVDHQKIANAVSTSGNFIYNMQGIDRASIQFNATLTGTDTIAITLNISNDGVHFVGFSVAKTVTLTGGGTTSALFELGAIDYCYLQVAWGAPSADTASIDAYLYGTGGSQVW